MWNGVPHKRFLSTNPDGYSHMQVILPPAFAVTGEQWSISAEDAWAYARKEVVRGGGGSPCGTSTWMQKEGGGAQR